MKDDSEIKKFIIEALDLVPDDVASIDVVVQLRGEAGTVQMHFVPPSVEER